MKVKFKKLIDGAVLPKKATEGAAAYDLYVPQDTDVKPGRQIIPLGFAMEMEPGYEALIDARSGFSAKGMEGYGIQSEYSFHLKNDRPYWEVRGDQDYAKMERKYIATEPDRFDCDVIQGKIDSDYRDGVGVIVHNRGGKKFVVKAGTRIAQMTFHKVETVEWEETDTLSETDRDGGFGSTGTGNE